MYLLLGSPALRHSLCHVRLTSRTPVADVASSAHTFPLRVLGKTLWSQRFSTSLDPCDAVTLDSTYMHVHHLANEHVNDLQLIGCPIYCLKEFICNCSLFPGLSVCDSIFHFDIPLSASYPSQRLSLSPFPLQRGNGVAQMLLFKLISILNSACKNQ